mgnify:CR=1 FL=1
MMPSPSHLQHCLLRPDGPVDDEPLTAPVVCPCGNNQFALLFPGATREVDGESYPVVARIDGKFFLVLVAHCTQCEECHLLLDKDLHGWDGYVCRDETQAALPRPPLVPWHCLTCGALAHRMSVTIYTEGPEDFIAESDGDLDPDSWPDAFGWFGLDTECAACGRKTESLIDYETM